MSGGGEEVLDDVPVAEINHILFPLVWDIFPYFCSRVPTSGKTCPGMFVELIRSRCLNPSKNKTKNRRESLSVDVSVGEMN